MKAPMPWSLSSWRMSSILQLPTPPTGTQKVGRPRPGRKQQGQEGVFVDGKRVEASAKTKKGFAALRSTLGHSVGDFTQALGALPDSYAPSLLAARQHGWTRVAAAAVARLVDMAPVTVWAPGSSPDKKPR